MKVYIAPKLVGEDNADGGIRRVVEAMHKYLPGFGIEIVGDADAADVVNTHGAMLVDAPGKPLVVSCHGLYWDDYDWDAWAHEANRRVAQALLRADAITSPSLWVENALARRMIKADTIYHGVEVEPWSASVEKLDCVLWNKARVDAVSNPEDLMHVASIASDIRFLTTFGEDRPNVKVMGPVPHKDMAEIIKHCKVYLCTARETFGIGTLEAMAAGAVVVGWDYAGQREIIRNGETGLLVPYGDYYALAAAIETALLHYDELAAAARADVLDRWLWQDKIAEYAKIFKRVAFQQPLIKTSIVLTSYNLDRYIDDALQSVHRQSDPNWECIIVDDCSTDDTAFRAKEWVETDPRFHYVKTSEIKNVGLSTARNVGIEHARGKYILPLDADDRLDEFAVARLSEALDKDPDLQVAFGGLRTFHDLGDELRDNPWPPQQFNLFAQLSHQNQLPYSSMMRAKTIRRLGGYRRRMWRAEDAEMWCRMAVFGGKIARATEFNTLEYRIRNDSKGATERAANHAGDPDGDWVYWSGAWAISHTSDGGRSAAVKGELGRPWMMPWTASVKPSLPMRFWHVKHYAKPIVTVIIPVGSGHEKYVEDALDSLLYQTFQDWCVIVVDDTLDQTLEVLHPFAKVFQTGGDKGTGFARNLGIAETNTELVIFLDADDYLTCGAIEAMCAAYVNHGGQRYIYTDGWVDNGKEVLRVDAPEYDQRWWSMTDQHTVTVLMATSVAEMIGFSEDLGGMEDLDFFVSCAIRGVCGARLNYPALVYRHHLGSRRKQAGQYAQILRERYEPYVRGEEIMPSCCGDTNAGQIVISIKQRLEAAALQAFGGSISSDQVGSGIEDAPTSILRFTGTTSGSMPFRGKGGRTYYGDTRRNKFAEVQTEDIEILVRTGKWEVVPRTSVSGEDESTPQVTPQ